MEPEQMCQPCLAESYIALLACPLAHIRALGARWCEAAYKGHLHHQICQSLLHQRPGPSMLVDGNNENTLKWRPSVADASASDKACH